ncbi:MAG: mechanosensitive ion channel family protein [Akkermansiaceae bacterium]
MIDWQNIQTTLWGLIDGREDRWQWIAIGICLVISFMVSRLLNRTLLAKGSHIQKFLTRFFNPGKRVNVTPFIFGLFLWITWAARSAYASSMTNPDAVPCNIVYPVTLLISAYVIYQVANAITQGNAAPRILGGGILVMFALHLFQWLDPVSEALQGISLPLGNIEINLWGIISAIAALFLLLWLVGLTTRFIDTALKPRNDIPPSIKVLIGKASRLCLYIAAIVGALKIGGVPLGGLAVFSGALGLGLGFGLQKVISNLVSGVIILLDKSIKPGDVIEIEGTFGWINSLRTRYISVITRDRKEILIPNEDFVTNKVINWSFTDRVVRVKADVGVSYDTDLEKAIALCKEASATVKRVLNTPEPNCLITGFGDSSVDLQVRFWIDDAPQGVSNVRSDVMLAVWKSFKEHGIEIPFPQRDLHIKSSNASSGLPET